MKRAADRAWLGTVLLVVASALLILDRIIAGVVQCEAAGACPW